MMKRQNAGTGRQKGKEAMATKKEQQQQNEEATAQALFMAIIAPDRTSQRKAAKLAAELAGRISSRALERAKLKAIAMANAKDDSERPQLTESVAFDAMEDFAEICRKHMVDEDCRDGIWQSIATFCMWQLKQKKGPFYDMARAEGVLDEVLS